MSQNAGISQCSRGGCAELAHLATSEREEPGEDTDRTCAESQEEEPAGVSTSRLDAHTYCSVAVHS